MTSGDRTRKRRCFAPAVLALAVVLALAAPAAGAELEDVGTYTSPIYVTSDPSDHTRLFVVERAGRVLLDDLDDPAPPSTFLDLASDPPLVLAGQKERGLFSLALPADFAETGRLYVAYSDADGDFQVDEYTASGDSASRSTRRPLLFLEHSAWNYHFGGQLQFGPDGYLYVSTGTPDGPQAQDPQSLQGKLLRIDPLPDGANPYGVPDDNPFVGIAGRDEIWSYGLRNPWRFSFDRATGALLIGDVGEDSWEEVDYEPVSAGLGKGDNFGWYCYEGTHDFLSASCSTTGPFTDPIFEFEHPAAQSFSSVTGGYVVRDPSVPDLWGRYVYADLGEGVVRSLTPTLLPEETDARSENLAAGFPVSFGEDACARVYVVLGGGPVKRLHGPTPAVCVFRGLSVGVAGSGSGRVFGPGIDCPGECAETYGDGTLAILTATPDAGSTFAGWEGCPGPDGSRCQLTMDTDRSVTASFTSNPSCGGRPTTIAGTKRGDVLRGTRKRDVISALGGRDVIHGLGGADRICGGAGPDRIAGGGGKDRLLGGGGRDRLRGGPAADTLKGGGGRDSLRGGPGRDRLRGGPGLDHVTQ